MLLVRPPLAVLPVVVVAVAAALMLPRVMMVLLLVPVAEVMDGVNWTVMSGGGG